MFWRDASLRLWEWNWHVSNSVPTTERRACASFISFGNVLPFSLPKPFTTFVKYLILYVALGNAIALAIFFPGGSLWACGNATDFCVLTWCLAAALKSFICYNRSFQWCLRSSLHQWSCPYPVSTEMICSSSTPQFFFDLFLGLEFQCEFCHDCRSVCWRQAPRLALDLTGDDLRLYHAVILTVVFHVWTLPLKWCSSLLILLNAFIMKRCRIMPNTLSTLVEKTLIDL